MRPAPRDARARILVAHPGLGAGGSEARAMALLEALQDRHRTTLVTGAPFEPERLNLAYQTAVDPQKIAVMTAPMPQILARANGGDALRAAFFGRFVRRIGSDFDLCISAYNFADFGRPGIHFVADFSWDDDIRRSFDPGSPGLRGVMQRPGVARSAYLGLCNAVAGSRMRPVHRDGDVVVANSRWTANLLRERHGLKSRVIYPPVHTAPVCGEERSGDFVMLGRIAPDKRILEAIDILAGVRERGHRFDFHVVGRLGADAYGRHVAEKARQAGDWVRLAGGLYGDAKHEFLGRHGFALHVRKREAFGIAVAEMIKAGLVPFVPGGSAPAEIVGDERLTFDDADHAVEVIDRMLRRPGEITAIRAGLAKRGVMFSQEAFAGQALALIEECLSIQPAKVLPR
ncbi:glycosyltransferase family 4 protein [Jiella pacifica]|uniref:Glycosyltransferase n=1 Tax=Jiella pacifica TaxID=2696469 RepID=A0A6N9T3F8_9HYPH|nr:glycosyltransferase family 4 protein [Jiella pacifica]NDW04369.1 glycosyltransferase [Jiella pacifica]